MTKLTKVSCPRCGKEGTWTSENKFKPFCSERCKMIDLGAWAEEKYRVAGEKVEKDEPEEGESS